MFNGVGHRRVGVVCDPRNRDFAEGSNIQEDRLALEGMDSTFSFCSYVLCMWRLEGCLDEERNLLRSRRQRDARERWNGFGEPGKGLGGTGTSWPADVGATSGCSREGVTGSKACFWQFEVVFAWLAIET